jgi:hypothetical protein
MQHAAVTLCFVLPEEALDFPLFPVLIATFSTGTEDSTSPIVVDVEILGNFQIKTRI